MPHERPSHMSGRATQAPKLFSRRYRPLVIAQVALLVLTVTLLLPYALILLVSFKSAFDAARAPFSLSFTPTLASYATILSQGDLLSYMKNTLFNAGGATLLATIIGVPAGYAMARVRFPLSGVLLNVLIGLRFVPYVTIMLPLYLIMIRYGLVGTNQGVIIAYQIIVLPLMVWITKSFFEQIPHEIEESAMIDGCTRAQSFWFIALPLITPAVVSVMTLGFIMCWNEFFIALLFSGRDAQPLTLGIQQFLAQEYHGASYGPVSAWAAATSLPVVLIALLMNRYLVQGLGGFGDV